MIAQVIKHPDSRLTRTAKPVSTEYGKLLLSIIQDLRDTMRAVTWGRAIGMSAPQIGCNLRLFIAYGEAIVNPVICDMKGKLIINREGCYSMQDEKYDYIAPRAKSVTLEFDKLDNQGNFAGRQRRKFHNAEAYTIQHEFDHLIGVVVSER